MDYVYRVEEFDRAVKETEERTEGRLRLEPRRLRVNPDSAAARQRPPWSNGSVGSRFGATSREDRRYWRARGR